MSEQLSRSGSCVQIFLLTQHWKALNFLIVNRAVFHKSLLLYIKAQISLCSCFEAAAAYAGERKKSVMNFVRVKNLVVGSGKSLCVFRMKIFFPRFTKQHNVLIKNSSATLNNFSRSFEIVFDWWRKIEKVLFSIYMWFHQMLSYVIWFNQNRFLCFLWCFLIDFSKFSAFTAYRDFRDAFSFISNSRINFSFSGNFCMNFSSTDDGMFSIFSL